MDIKFIIFPYPFKVCGVFNISSSIFEIGSLCFFPFFFPASNGWTFINVVSLFKEYVFGFIDSWCLFFFGCFQLHCLLLPFFFVIFKPRPTIVKTPNLKLWITREFPASFGFNLLFLRWKALVINLRYFFLSRRVFECYTCFSKHCFSWISYIVICSTLILFSVIKLSYSLPWDVLFGLCRSVLFNFQIFGNLQDLFLLFIFSLILLC